MNLKDFGDLQTFHLAPPTAQNLTLSKTSMFILLETNYIAQVIQQHLKEVRLYCIQKCSKYHSGDGENFAKLLRKLCDINFIYMTKAFPLASKFKRPTFSSNSASLLLCVFVVSQSELASNIYQPSNK